jgi:hypothetical protein
VQAQLWCRNYGTVNYDIVITIEVVVAQAIMTQEQVFALADQLATSGEKPTMTRIREMIGGGSYSTIKAYLDVWKQER